MLLLFISLFAIAFSQPPGGGPPPSGGDTGGDSSSSTTCDMYGGSASYLETVDSGASTRTLTSSGCPNHYAICTGKGFSVCGAEGEEGTDTEAAGSDGSKVITIPLYPKLQPNGVSTDLEYTLGEIATALNGVSIFNGAVSQTELLEVDNCSSEWMGFDCCGGHAENSGDYHYHFAPACLMDQAGTVANGHSAQLGWAFDGFPIYGIYSVGGVQVQNCGTAGADATYCQDDCGGIEFTDSSVDEYTYRYYMTGEQGDLGTLPMYPRPGVDDPASAFDKFYPYTIKCYRGYTESEDDSAGVDGTTENFVAQPVDGYSDVHPTVCTATTWECTDGVTTYSNPGTSVQTDETTTTTSRVSSTTTTTTTTVVETTLAETTTEAETTTQPETTTQAVPLYSSEGNYNSADIQEARDKCSAIGTSLCTIGQVFNAVYNEGYADLCYSGYFEGSYDGQSAGWFNNAEGTCSGLGWQGWTPGKPGAHCCSSELADVTPADCSAFTGCADAGDYLLVDDAETIFCPSGTCDVSTCCKSWVAAPEYITLPESFPKYRYETAEEADAACQAYHSDLQLCTKNEVQGAAEEVSICASAFWVTQRNEENVNTEYGQGWFTGEAFSADCNGAVGEQTWAPNSGLGAAHCCVKSYQKSGYRVINSYDDSGEYSQAGAEAYCESLGYSYSLCSQDQLEWIVSMDEPNVCMSGFMTDAQGWWQGDYQVSGCGGADRFTDWLSPVAGAHCCLNYVLAPPKGGPYGILPQSGAYGQSDMTSGEVAEQACADAGYDGLCTLGQQAYVEDNSAIYGDIACKVGWVMDGDGYDSGYWSSCGVADTWNNGWQPAANPVAHCCAADTPEREMTAYPYYNGNWDQYATQDEAAAMCTGDYNLCTVDQVRLVATDGVDHDGVYQQETGICRIGWFADGQKGWWQGDDSCGASGWRTFGDESSAATYHCCLSFEASFSTTQPPTPSVFIQQPDSGYPYGSADEALAACQDINAEYSLCADYEIIEAAMYGIESVEGWQGVDPQHNLCYSGYTDPDRSVDYLYGWYVHEGTCNGGEGWKSWLKQGTHAGAYCCYSPAFAPAPTDPPTTEAKETTEAVDDETTEAAAEETTQEPEEETEAPSDVEDTTEAPEETEAPSDDEETTEAPATSEPATEEPATEEPATMPPAEDSLPSSLSNPSDCVDTGFSVEGFESLYFCESADTVYLNGRDTCVASGGDQTEMYQSLQDVFDNSWYLAGGDCDGGRSYDEATQDQLWMTNEMCNNLEDDIAELETQTSEYMDSWTASVIDLVNSQMSNFDEDTQAALSAYLDTLQE